MKLLVPKKQGISEELLAFKNELFSIGLIN
jgi:hypothetical protein